MQHGVSRGANSPNVGYAYELKIANRIKSGGTYKQMPIQVGTTAASSGNPDIPLTIFMPTGLLKINIEAKDKGAFEGGCKKLYPTSQGMQIQEDCIQKTILGDKSPYNGAILPWYRGLRTIEDWQKEKHIFEKDVYMEAAEDAIATYYASKGTQYIQIEGKGLYHTGADPLDLGVPMFKSKIILRIRSSKHKRKINGQRVPTDVTAGLQFDRRTLPASPYTFDEGGQLPPHFSLLLQQQPQQQPQQQEAE
jgi:hypothetical protein